MSKSNGDSFGSIEDDKNLLDVMIADMKSLPEVYGVGKYWRRSVDFAHKEILRAGLANFRGSSAAIGISCTDNVSWIDVRNQLRYENRPITKFVINNCSPIRRVLSRQHEITENLFKDFVRARDLLIRRSPAVSALLQNFVIPKDTCRGGCLATSEINGEKVAQFYMENLNSHSVMARHIDFKSAKSFLEIGGGFGANMHLLVENYKNLRKYVYLDIMPNLYFGTQYLKSFYGDSVKTYSDTRSKQTLTFSQDDSLEILCIAPHQVERLDMKIDIFQDEHSLVTIPPDVIRKYAQEFDRLSKPGSSIAMCSYGGWDLTTTIHPDTLPSYFDSIFGTFTNTKELFLLRPVDCYYYTATRQ